MSVSTTMDNSKTLKKTDDSSARLILNLLSGSPGYGIDVDIIFKTRKGWVIIEFLKCESTLVTPVTSHPSKYWSATVSRSKKAHNWRKFVRLFQIAKELNGMFFLINYEESGPNNYGRFRIMKVNMAVTPSEKICIETTDVYKDCDFPTMQKWYMAVNNHNELL